MKQIGSKWTEQKFYMCQNDRFYIAKMLVKVNGNGRKEVKESRFH